MKRKKNYIGHVRNYLYGAKAPVCNMDLIERQMWLSRRFRNNLIKIERWRRGCCNVVLDRYYPGLTALQAEVDAAEEALKEYQKQLHGNNQAARKRTVQPDQQLTAKELKSRKNALLNQLKPLKTAAWKDERVTSETAVFWEQAAARKKRVQAACTRMGLYWGNYLWQYRAMENAHKGPPPKFRHYRGDGCVVVQLQNGLSVGELQSGLDRRVQLLPWPAGDTRTCSNRPKPDGTPREPHPLSSPRWRMLRLRIGSDDHKRPIWTELPLNLHRPLPDDARIQWVVLFRKRVGTRNLWSVMISLASSQFNDGPVGVGRVAVNPGWRQMPEGLRVATWLGDDGASGHVIIPNYNAGKWHKSRSLKSIRSRNLDESRTLLADWLDAHPQQVPAWLQQETATLRNWRSEQRLTRLVGQWATQRFAGDEQIYPLLDMWRRQDRHLCDWEMSNRLNAVNWRNNFYRNVVKELRARYSQLIIEDINWKELGKRMEAEEKTPETFDREEEDHNRTIAAPGTLVAYLKEKMAYKELTVDYTTVRCHACRQICTFDAAAELWHTCEHCGAAWDQDLNNCRNLLRQAQEGDPEAAVA